MSNAERWFDAKSVAHWLCRECQSPIQENGKLFGTWSAFVAMDQDAKPICLCAFCWQSPAQKGVASEGFTGSLREYHERQAVQP